MPGRATGPRPDDARGMRFNLLSISVAVAVVGCILFTVGGFMLFPLAFDIWERGASNKPAA